MELPIGLRQRSSAHDSNASDVSAYGLAAVASRNFWLPASVDAKFIRASIAPVENHDCPRSQPDDVRRVVQHLPHVRQRRQRVVDREAASSRRPSCARTTNSTGQE